MDGALATFHAITTIDLNLTLVTKVLDQVLFQDELESIRTNFKKRINRIRTLNEIRNKMAHGRVVLQAGQDDGLPRFAPYYIEAADARAKHLFLKRGLTSVVRRQEFWTLQELLQKEKDLEEGRTLSLSLIEDQRKLHQTHRGILRRAARLSLDQGIPYDLTPLENSALHGLFGSLTEPTGL